VDRTTDISEFLASRRAKVTPAEVGLPSYGRRRVQGLRREEVASLAGVSIEYYRRLERGSLAGASDQVLDGVARALRLDDAERAHLFDLARAASPDGLRPKRPASIGLRPVFQRSLDQMTMPALVGNARGDYLGANRLGRALYAPLLDSVEQPANGARFTFLDPAARDFFPEWEQVANDIVAGLHSESGRNPYDRRLSDLIGELSTRSDEFRSRWASRNVRFHRSGSKRIHHPIVGDLELSYESMELPADPGLALSVFTAEADSPSQRALDLLASWATTPVELATEERGQASDQRG
jgi:transcriptional regulator with XRE-family HTH domain